MGEIKVDNGVKKLRLTGLLVVVAMGLTLRLTGYEVGLPYVFVKYGGSVLWGMMVYWLVASILAKQSVGKLVVLACFFAAIVEFSRLFHTSQLDAFRLTLPGALLLGRIFSWFNILAYFAGIGMAALSEKYLIYIRR